MEVVKPIIIEAPKSNFFFPKSLNDNPFVSGNKPTLFTFPGSSVMPQKSNIEIERSKSDMSIDESVVPT